MKTLMISALVAVGLAIASPDADAAKRFGGGNNLGKQRAVPTQPATPPSAAPTQAAKPAPATPPATPAAPAAKPSFMQRWGGLLAGLGIGALLASMFGGTMGPIMGMLLMGLLAAAVIMILFKLFAGRRNAPVPAAGPAVEPTFDRNAEAGNRPAFSGIGSAIPGSATRVDEPVAAAAPVSTNTLPEGFDGDAFLRVAKTSFIRLQAANDAGDLNDIRDYTTPEMYAELSMLIKERGGVTQKTEVVSVDASLLEVVNEGDYQIASVRFWGLMREAPGANPESFDEIWHVRKNLRERNGAWLIAGIQQNG